MINNETANMTQPQRQNLKKEYDFYFGKLKLLWDYDPDEDLTDEEFDRYEEKCHYYSDMAELKNFQLMHDISLTSYQERMCREWLLDGFPFKFDFDVGVDGFVPIDKKYGCCYLDYLLTDSEKFKVGVDKYRTSCLCCIHEDDDEYDGLIKQFSILSMKEFLLDHPGFSDEEISGCIEWINNGRSFRSNPWNLTDEYGYQSNYLEANMMVNGDETAMNEYCDEMSETISKFTDAVRADMDPDIRESADDGANALDMLLRGTIDAMDIKKACEENDDIDEEGFMDIYLQNLSSQLNSLKKAYRDKYKDLTGHLEVIIDDEPDEASTADVYKGYDMEKDDIQF